MMAALLDEGLLPRTLPHTTHHRHCSQRTPEPNGGPGHCRKGQRASGLQPELSSHSLPDAWIILRRQSCELWVGGRRCPRQDD